jgi:RTX calcium-binding nonapeptide repeat (4 copies)
MKLGRGKALCYLGMLAAGCVATPAAASAQPSVTPAVWTVHGQGARVSAAVNVLTLNDQRRIDNRISASIASNGRLVLTAPEGLGDPDGSGANCDLDNAKSGETSATEVSCAAGYIGAIVGNLGGGHDTFDADPGLTVMVGAVIDGQIRPLSGGPGRDRLVGGALPDLLAGGGGPDSLVGGGGDDLLVGGAGTDKLIGGGGRDVCRGGGGTDTAKSCEQVRSIP